MTQETYNNLEVGDKVYFTQKYRTRIAENLYDMYSVRGKVQDNDAGFVQDAKIVINDYEFAKVVYKMTDVVGEGPRIKCQIYFSDGTTDISVVSLTHIYKKRNEND